MDSQGNNPANNQMMMNMMMKFQQMMAQNKGNNPA